MQEMKIVRLIQITLYACALLIVGGLAYRALFASGSGSSRGFGYGNLWVQYSIHDRGILDPKVEWLIATPLMPSNQTYSGAKDQWTYSFEGGKDFSFSADSKNLVWVDPDLGPQKVSTSLSRSLIQRINDTREASIGKKFKSAEEFLSWIENSNAQPQSSGVRQQVKIVD